MTAMQSDRDLLENQPCPLNCPPNDEHILAGRDRLHDLPGDFQVVKCRTCGLMRTNPRPSPETMGFYYPDSYGPYLITRVNLNNTPQTQWHALKALGRKLGQWLINRHLDCLPHLQPGRMLEIGCASGAFLHRMAADGWKVEGIELSEKAAGHARSLGYQVHVGPLETAPDPGQPYDLVVGWMVLEHLHDPVRALRKLHSWTRLGGWLAISVPNAKSFGFSAFKNAWFALHLPNHLYHFTPETLEQILERGGWSMRRIFYQREIRDLFASFGYVMKDRHSFLKFAEKLIALPWERRSWVISLHPIAYLLSLFGQTVAMTVWAKRKDAQGSEWTHGIETGPYLGGVAHFQRNGGNRPQETG